MSKRLGITEQRRLTDAIVEEMVDMEEGIDMLFTASDHLNNIVGKVPPVLKSVGKSLNRWSTDLRELSMAYDQLYKEFGKHFPI